MPPGAKIYLRYRRYRRDSTRSHHPILTRATCHLAAPTSVIGRFRNQTASRLIQHTYLRFSPGRPSRIFSPHRAMSTEPAEGSTADSPLWRRPPGFPVVLHRHSIIWSLQRTTGLRRRYSFATCRSLGFLEHLRSRPNCSCFKKLDYTSQPRTPKAAVAQSPQIAASS